MKKIDLPKVFKNLSLPEKKLKAAEVKLPEQQIAPNSRTPMRYYALGE